MRKVLAIAGLDIIRALRWKSLLVQGIAVPIIMTLMVSLAFGRVSLEGPLERIAVADLSSSRFSRDIISALEEIQSFEVVKATESEIESLVTEEAVSFGVIFPAGFEADIRAGRPGLVRVVSLEKGGLSPGQLHLRTALSRLEASVVAANEAARALREMWGNLSGVDVEGEAARVWTQTYEQSFRKMASPPVTTHVTSVQEVTSKIGSLDAISVKNHSSIGFLIMFVGMTMISMLSSSFVTDREENTMQRLLSCPVGVWTVSSGKILASLFVGALSTSILVGFGAILGVPWSSNLAGAVAVIVPFLVSMSALGMLVGVLSKTRAQATAVGTLVSVIGAMLGGCWWPLEIVPPFMRNFAYITPFGWGMTGLSGAVGRGQAPAEVLVYGWVLLGMAAVFFTLGAYSLGRQRA